MLYKGVLINDLDEVDDVLVFRLRNVIVNLEQLLHVLELRIILNKCLEETLVLLVTYLYEILSL
jgi:hypothetical protein